MVVLMTNSVNNEVEQEDNKVDWDELIGESPKFIEITKFEFVLILFLIFFILFVLHTSIWGMWADGDQ